MVSTLERHLGARRQREALLRNCKEKSSNPILGLYNDKLRGSQIMKVYGRGRREKRLKDLLISQRRDWKGTLGSEIQRPRNLIPSAVCFNVNVQPDLSGNT